MTVEEHYRALAPKLTNWLVATGSPYAEACDIVQSAFLKLWKMRDDLKESDAAVAGLVFTMAKNLRKNIVRDDRRITFVDEINDESAVTSSQKSLPSDNAYLRSRLAAAFAKLPPTLREAYTLFQVAEMSIREISQHTGVSENLVKVRIFRAKEKLRTILADLVTF